MLRHGTSCRVPVSLASCLLVLIALVIDSARVLRLVAHRHLLSPSYAAIVSASTGVIVPYLALQALSLSAHLLSCSVLRPGAVASEPFT